jgi:hypothetical protein
MSVTRKNEDAGVVPDREKVWPRRFLESTPTLGWTPNLPDEANANLVVAARKAVRKAFGSVEPAVDADPPPSV